jgi:hypothetical protein
MVEKGLPTNESQKLDANKIREISGRLKDHINVQF